MSERKKAPAPEVVGAVHWGPDGKGGQKIVVEPSIKGASKGAVIGGFVAGPVGAAVGAILGGVLGPKD